jgi:predicted ATPase
MLDSILGVEPDLTALKRLIIERTSGNPFFMEETVQALLDDGALVRNGGMKITRPVAELTIPTTVQAILSARIDRLPAPDKELLQTLAVIGSELRLELIKGVTSKSEEQLEPMLSDLQQSEFIYEQPSAGGVAYTFKHALTQEVAYNSLLTERRRLLHEQTARAVEALYAEQLEERYAELARHHLRGTDCARAVQYAQLAAEQAINRAAYREATSMVEDALELVGQLPTEAARLRAELGLRNLQSGIAFAVHGGGSRERENAIRSGCLVGERIGGKEHLASLLNLCNFHFQRGEPAQVVELAQRCLNLAEATGDPGLLSVAHLMAGLIAWSSGRLSEVLTHCENYAARIESIPASSAMTLLSIGSVGVPNATAILTLSASPLHLLGRIGDAAKAVEDNLRQARESRRLIDLALVLTVTAETFRYFLREPESALAQANEAIAISEDNGFSYWLHRGRFVRGWALADLGQLAEGLAEMESAMAGFRQIGGVPFAQFATARLGYTYARTGQTEKGCALLNQALEQIERTGERVVQAEVLRLKGEILLMRDPEALNQAEDCFRAALEVARVQEAKWCELRATVSLARLLCDTNRRDKAHTILAEIYNWFTEGFDTADLKEAKALLDDLSV